MIIGIDFDNTIVSYDPLFYTVALESQLIPDNLPKNKIAVRNYLRQTDRESEWTLLQGRVYGNRMNDAIPHDGVLQFMKNAQLNGHKLCIISHKTRNPFLGPAYDLHEAAYKWIESAIISQGIYLKKNSNIFFELTKEDKILRISNLDCDVFIDDLPEILNMKGFLNKTQRVLYDPENTYGSTKSSFQVANTWEAIQNILFI